MNKVIFILGAGFNVDACTIVKGEKYFYPLVKDLLQECFRINELPGGKSVEDLFQEALDKKQSKPFNCLSYLLMEADYFIGQEFTKTGKCLSNPYWLLLERFPYSHFITFNYDSLIEILLLESGRWRPEDGYGIPVYTEINKSYKNANLPERSKNHVLHLHGTLSVYPVEFYLKKNNDRKMDLITHYKQQQFVFDPDSLSNRFPPFHRVMPGPDYKEPYQRVIAPVRNKSSELNKPFIEGIYKCALDKIRNADTVVAIGYSFGRYDRASYEPLIRTIVEKKNNLIIVSPDANNIAGTLKSIYGINLTPAPFGFKEWANRGFPIKRSE